MDRGTAMPAVVLDVYKCGKDLIPGWNAHDARRSDALAVLDASGGWTPGFFTSC